MTAVPLAVTEYGADGPPVVVLHGLFGSGRNWMSVSRRLADRCHVLAPDLRNHGSSPWSPTHTYEAMAADLGALLEERALGPAALVGHSMGGKAAMLLALHRPDLVARLVVVDGAPVSYPQGFAADARAMAAADLAGATRRAEVDKQLAAAVPEPGVRAFLLQNLVLDASGPRWRVNLPVLEAAMPTISGFPATDGARYDGPVLFVAGGRSDYVRRDQADIVLGLFPHADLTVVPEAGHWVPSGSGTSYARSSRSWPAVVPDIPLVIERCHPLTQCHSGCRPLALAGGVGMHKRLVIIVFAIGLVLATPGQALAFGSGTWTVSGCSFNGQSAGHAGVYADAVTSHQCSGKTAGVRLRAANGSVTGWVNNGNQAYIQRSFSENDWVGADHRACTSCSIRST